MEILETPENAGRKAQRNAGNRLKPERPNYAPSDIHHFLGDLEGVTQCDPSGYSTSGRQGRGQQKHVFIENSSDSNIKVQSSTFVGRAGPGNFHGVQDLPPAQADYAWMFTRLSEYKKDTAKLASGNVVWAGTNAETRNAAPKMVTCETVEAELGAAAIGANMCLKIYGHSTTKTAKTVKIVPSDKPYSNTSCGFHTGLRQTQNST